MPSLVSFVVDNEPPAHLNELAAHNILHHPEVNAAKHQHEDVCKGLREHNRKEKVPICREKSNLSLTQEVRNP